MFRDEDDWLPSWFNRRRHPFLSRNFFDDFDEKFMRMHERMYRELDELTKVAPQDLRKTRVLPDGTKVEEWGPFVYGYSVRIGQDGKPEIREFGNIKRQPQLGKATINVKKEREPLIDVTVVNDDIKVVAELPGADKNEIKLHGTEDSLTISVDNPERSYYKEIKLPQKVDVRKAHSTFKNGVLEVNLPTYNKDHSKGVSIKID